MNSPTPADAGEKARNVAPAYDAASMGAAVYPGSGGDDGADVAPAPAARPHAEPVPVAPAYDAASMGGAVYADADTPPAAAASLAALTPLLRELNDLKRVRAAHFAGSYADRLFIDAWRQLLAGADVTTVALNVTARAVVAVRLAGIDAAALRTHGLNDAETADLFAAALDDVGEAVPAYLRVPLRQAVKNFVASEDHSDPTTLPAFVGQLLRQPRAGATHPGKPRYVLEPAESHGDHCLLVAVYGVLVSPRFGGDAGTAFLIGLAHHLFNGTLPDAGFNGDVVMHKAGVLDRIAAAAFAHAYAELHARSPDLEARVRVALAFTKQTQAAESRCFHAADVFDRVLEMDFFAKAARFTLADAVKGLDIVHVAPEQAFQRRALVEAGIWTEFPDA